MRRVVVLNTRPRHQAPELSRLLLRAGFEPIEAPAIAIAPAWLPSELEQVRRDLRAGRFDWVVLPSRNAAQGLESDLKQSGARLVCGAATAAALGVSPEISLERFSASAALEALRPRLALGERVLVPRATEGRDELIEGLCRLGSSVLSPVAYRTVPVADATSRLSKGGIDVVTLCSPSAVRSVAPAIRNETLVVCLGETTARAAREVGLRVDAVAARTTMASLVAAIQSLPLPAGARV